MVSGDIEAGNNVDLWAFIRKVYVIVALQLLLIVTVVTVVVLVAAIPNVIPVVSLRQAPSSELSTSDSAYCSDCIRCGVVMLVFHSKCGGCYPHYTFWATARGRDHSFLGPFLMVSLLVLIVFALIQIFIPFGKLGSTIVGPAITIVFSGFIIHDTDGLIKRRKYDESIWASITLYIDIANLFLGMLGMGC